MQSSREAADQRPARRRVSTALAGPGAGQDRRIGVNGGQKALVAGNEEALGGAQEQGLLK